jgi:hypothetical protein
MSELPDRFVLRPKAKSSVYHTSDCLAVSRAGEQEARPVSDRNIEWHEWDVCAYCAGEAQAGGDTT